MSNVYHIDDKPVGLATAVIINDSTNGYQPEPVVAEEQPRYLFGVKLPSYYNKGEERAVVRKLDIFLLSYTCLSTFMQTLDNTNISNAYVSGMKTDLGLYGNELNYFSTTFNCGIITGAGMQPVPFHSAEAWLGTNYAKVPLMLLSTWVKPSILMPVCELCWTALVMGIAGAKNAQTIYGLRFVCGFFQGIAFPGFAALVGSWYTPSELGKRMALYEVSSTAAGMFSGYIQAGLYAHMNGKSMASWRWLFIFDGIISIPIALWGFYAIPDQPNNSTARWLSAAYKEIAIRRMDNAGRKPVQKVTWGRFKSIWSTWHVYLFVACYVLYGAFSWGDGYFGLWIQSLRKYSVEDINNIPTAGPAAALVNSLFSGFLSDYLGNRPLIIVANMLVCMSGNVFLSVWRSPEWLKFVGYIFITTGLPAQSQTIAWINEVCQGNGTLRGLIVSIGNTLVYAINAWALVLLFPAVDGLIAVAILTVSGILATIGHDVKTGKAIRNTMGLLEFKAWTSLKVEQEEENQSRESHVV
ncbi:major facilitator superfamily transporter [Ophiostoma piceae UAMH 11346]|uniref:Major facilitator superfamily transporter n=1 Tax=Ophiostoma piceae (strain UAMH 11346) TaxID=1262450 RepID=S3BMM4_OPHP1|nr:major facilitator superfamily transporter [Ophiostoma piceae UAMH 11346]